MRCALILFTYDHVNKQDQYTEWYDNDTKLVGHRPPETWNPKSGPDYQGTIVLDARKCAAAIATGPMLQVNLSTEDMKKNSQLPRMVRFVNPPAYTLYVVKHGGIIGRVVDGGITFDSLATEK